MLHVDHLILSSNLGGKPQPSNKTLKYSNKWSSSTRNKCLLFKRDALRVSIEHVFPFQRDKFCSFCSKIGFSFQYFLLFNATRLLEVQILKDKGKEDSDAKKQELNEVCTSSSQSFTRERPT